MPAVIMDSGKRAFLDYLTMFGGIPLANVRYHLYVNDHVPAHGDTLANYVEAAWAGYTPIAASSWLGSMLTPDFHASTSTAVMTFGNTSGATQTTFGYYVTEPGGLTLLYAERFAPSPIVLPAGFTVTLAPTFTDTSEF